MIRITAAGNSCGVKLLHGEIYYKTAETYFKDLAGLYYKADGSQAVPPYKEDAHADHTVFVYSHQPAKYTIGHDIKKYIEDHNLGTVTVSATGINPVHKSPICVWVWVRNNETFEKHCKELLCNSGASPTAGLTNSTGSEVLLPLGAMTLSAALGGSASSNIAIGRNSTPA
jgi:hypothetical protein